MKLSLRSQLRTFGYKDIRFTDVSVDTKTSAMLIGIWMDGHQFTLIAMPASDSPITWLNSISLEEKGAEAEKILRDLQRIFAVRKFR